MAAESEATVKAAAEPEAADILHSLEELPGRLPEAVGEARDTNRPVFVMQDDQPLGAIVSMAELVRLYDLEQRLFDLEEQQEARTIFSELEAAEARGDVEWYTTEQMRELQRALVGEAREQIKRGQRRGEAPTK